MRYRTLLLDDLDVLADAVLGVVWRVVQFFVLLLTAVMLLVVTIDRLYPAFPDGRTVFVLGLGLTGVGIAAFALWVFGLEDASELEQATMDVGGQVWFLVQETDAIDEERAEQWRTDGFEHATVFRVAAGGIGVLVAGTVLQFYLEYWFRGYLALALSAAVLHVLIRSDVAPVRPLSQHVGISLFGIPAVLPFGVVHLLVVSYLYDAIGGPRPVLPGLSVSFLAGLAAVYCATIYCLLLAADGVRTPRVIDATAPRVATTTPATEASPERRRETVTLAVFALQVPAYALGAAYAVGPTVLAAGGITVLVLALVVVPASAGLLTRADLGAGTVVAGVVVATLAGAGFLAARTTLGAVEAYEPALWLPVAALVGFVTGVLLFATIGSRNRATARSG